LQAQTASISLSQNVQVSADRPHEHFWENMICANPENANELVAVTEISDKFVATPEPHHEFSPYAVVYRSTDGGASWKTVMVSVPQMQDPTCAFGPSGTIYIAGGHVKDFSGVTFSHDGGATWTQAEIPSDSPPSHGPYLSVDLTPGQYHGRVYLTTLALGKDIWTVSPALWSADGGRTFSVFRVRHDPMTYFGNNVVMPDGTFAFLEPVDADPLPDFEKVLEPQKEHRRLKLQIFRSHDGGKSFADPVTVASIETDDREQQMVIPAYLAVDAASAAFKGRLYVVWKDNHVGREQILVSSSADAGDTWTSPVAVDDVSRTFTAGFTGKGPNNVLPQIAVNPAGVVGVSWYDRRDSVNNFDYRIRFSASLDGGETWLPSALVSTEPNLMNRNAGSGRSIIMENGGKGRYYIHSLRYSRPAGDYAGLAAAADGRFHLLWNDNRTGLPQIFTASATVNGQPVNRFAGHADVTQMLQLNFANTEYDHAAQTIFTDLTIKNSGKASVHGPLLLHINHLHSVLARNVAVVDPATQKAGPSIVIEIPSSAELGPEASLTVSKLAFRALDLISLTSPELEDPLFRGVTAHLIDFDARVYAKD
jgi:hypothetical protein